MIKQCAICGRERLFSEHIPGDMCDDCRVERGFVISVRSDRPPTTFQWHRGSMGLWRTQCSRFRVPFDDTLTLNKVLTAFNRRCVICGVPVTWCRRAKHRTARITWATIDHITPLQYSEYGHTEDNVVLMCWSHNAAKHSARNEYVETKLRYIAMAAFSPFDDTHGWSALRWCGRMTRDIERFRYQRHGQLKWRF